VWSKQTLKILLRVVAAWHTCIPQTTALCTRTWSRVPLIGGLLSRPEEIALHPDPLSFDQPYHQEVYIGKSVMACPSLRQRSSVLQCSGYYRHHSAKDDYESWLYCPGQPSVPTYIARDAPELRLTVAAFVSPAALITTTRRRHASASNAIKCLDTPQMAVQSKCSSLHISTDVQLHRNASDNTSHLSHSNTHVTDNTKSKLNASPEVRLYQERRP
jgi:hypothetical protein